MEGGTTQHAVSERVGNLVKGFQAQNAQDGGHGAAELRELTELNQRLLDELAAKSTPENKTRPRAPKTKGGATGARPGRLRPETPWTKRSQARAVLSPYQEVVSQTSG